MATVSAGSSTGVGASGSGVQFDQMAALIIGDNKIELDVRFFAQLQQGRDSSSQLVHQVFEGINSINSASSAWWSGQSYGAASDLLSGIASGDAASLSKFGDQLGLQNSQNQQLSQLVSQAKDDMHRIVLNACDQIGQLGVSDPSNCGGLGPQAASVVNNGRKAVDDLIVQLLGQIRGMRDANQDAASRFQNGKKKKEATGDGDSDASPGGQGRGVRLDQRQAQRDGGSKTAPTTGGKTAETKPDGSQEGTPAQPRDGASGAGWDEEDRSLVGHEGPREQPRYGDSPSQSSIVGVGGPSGSGGSGGSGFLGANGGLRGGEVGGGPAAGGQGNLAGGQGNLAGGQGNLAGGQGNLAGGQGNLAGGQGNLAGGLQQNPAPQENRGNSVLSTATGTSEHTGAIGDNRVGPVGPVSGTGLQSGAPATSPQGGSSAASTPGGQSSGDTRQTAASTPQGGNAGATPPASPQGPLGQAANAASPLGHTSPLGNLANTAAGVGNNISNLASTAAGIGNNIGNLASTAAGVGNNISNLASTAGALSGPPVPAAPPPTVPGPTFAGPGGAAPASFGGGSGGGGPIAPHQPPLPQAPPANASPPPPPPSDAGQTASTAETPANPYGGAPTSPMGGTYPMSAYGGQPAATGGRHSRSGLGPWQPDPNYTGPNTIDPLGSKHPNQDAIDTIVRLLRLVLDSDRVAREHYPPGIRPAYAIAAHADPDEIVHYFFFTNQGRGWTPPGVVVPRATQLGWETVPPAGRGGLLGRSDPGLQALRHFEAMSQEHIASGKRYRLIAIATSLELNDELNMAVLRANDKIVGDVALAPEPRFVDPAGEGGKTPDGSTVLLHRLETVAPDAHRRISVLLAEKADVSSLAMELAVDTVEASFAYDRPAFLDVVGALKRGEPITEHMVAALRDDIVAAITSAEIERSQQEAKPLADQKLVKYASDHTRISAGLALLALLEGDDNAVLDVAYEHYATNARPDKLSAFVDQLAPAPKPSF